MSDHYFGEMRIWQSSGWTKNNATAVSEDLMLVNLFILDET